MRIIAVDFAATPSGYFTSVVVAVTLALGGFAVKRQSKVNDTHTRALEQATRALDVLVSEHASVAAATTANTGAIRALEVSTAVLKQRLDSHEDWSRAQRTEIVEQFRRAHP